LRAHSPILPDSRWIDILHRRRQVHPISRMCMEIKSAFWRRAAAFVPPLQ
jgi:hypothetical protein